MKFSDLSEPEKVTLQSFWSQCPERREASEDDDPTLGAVEERIVQRLGQPADFTFGAPVGRCDQTQYIALGKDFPFKNLYCANCGTELKKLENDNFEMVCDCGINSEKYDFDLITFDPLEHIRRAPRPEE